MLRNCSKVSTFISSPEFRVLGLRGLGFFRVLGLKGLGFLGFLGSRDLGFRV